MGLGRDGDLHGGQRGTAVLRAQPPGGGLGLNPRYAADLVPTAAVLASVVLADTRLLVSARSALGAAAAYAAVAGCTTLVVLPHTYNAVDKGFVEAVRADLRADPQVVLYDGGVPDDMMVGGSGRREAVRGPRRRAREPGLRRPGVPPAHG